MPAFLGLIVISGRMAGLYTSSRRVGDEYRRNQSMASSSTAEIRAPSRGYTFPLGQTYTYSAEWHLMSAGTATLRMESAESEHHSLMYADTSGVVNLLYPVHDRLQSSFDPRSFCSLALKKHAEEGSRRRETQVHFEYPAGKSVLEEKNLKTGEAKRAEHDVPKCVTDVISGFYYLASLPLKESDVYSFPINDGGPTSQVEARPEAREQVKTPSGIYNTVRVAAQATSGPLQGKGKLWIWYSDDKPRVPVQIKVRVKWGTLWFRLTRVQSN